jgi:hypothetical protein
MIRRFFDRATGEFLGSTESEGTTFGNPDDVVIEEVERDEDDVIEGRAKPAIEGGRMVLKTTDSWPIVLRMKRDQLLKDSDFTEFASWRATKSPTVIAAWELYRQALRDMPQATDINAVRWPTKPATR